MLDGAKFNEYNIVHYYDFGRFSAKECSKKEYFEKLESHLSDLKDKTFLTYNESFKEFYLYLYGDGMTYRFIPTKDQMKEFHNNEDTSFNRSIRHCLELSENKKRYYKIVGEGNIDNIDDAIFLNDYLCDRNLSNDKYAKEARKYILENVNDNFEQYIEYFNKRVEELKDKNKETPEKLMKLLRNKVLIALVIAIIGIHLLFLSLGIPTVSIQNLVFLSGFFSTVGGFAYATYQIVDNNDFKKQLNIYNYSTKDMEKLIKKLKEKEHEVNKTSSVTKEEKIDKNLFESKLAYSLYLLRKEASELEKTEKEYVDLETKNISKFYNDEMKSFEYQKGQYKLTLETEQTIQNKVVKRIQELDNYISLRKNKSNQEYEIDEDIVMQISNSNNAFIRALKQGIK